MDNSTKKKWTPGRILLVILGLAVLSAGVSLYVSYQVLTCSRYEIHSEKLTAGVRVVMLSDLHNNSFGRGNARLVERVRREEPDLIVICGDLLNQSEEQTETAAQAIRALTDVAPVYVSYGNHEQKHQKLYGSDFSALCAEAGATLLEGTWEDLTVNGQLLRLGGILGTTLHPKQYARGTALGRDTLFILDMQETDTFTMLLCHYPVTWICYEGLNLWNVDLVFSGHAHGGQVRLPWIGGLYAPDQGYFPGREAGVYLSQDEERAMVLSRGLGSDRVGVPRFNNSCEIVTVDLLPEETAP